MRVQKGAFHRLSRDDFFSIINKYTVMKLCTKLYKLRDSSTVRSAFEKPRLSINRYSCTQ